MSTEIINFATGNIEKDFSQKKDRVEMSTKETNTSTEETEKGEFSRAWKKIIILDESVADQRIFSPVLIGPEIEDPTSLYLTSQIITLKSWLKKFSSKIRRKEKRRSPRPKRERRDILVPLLKIKEFKQKRLDILEGKDFRPIKIIKEEGKIVGWEFGEFTSIERDWWKLTRTVPELFERVAHSPEDAELLERGFQLRYKIKHGSEDEKQLAQKEWEEGEFANTIRGLDEERGIKIIGPLLRQIGEKV
jgi:hypothetical protein